MSHKSKYLKLRAILYYYKSKNQTSKIFGCSPRTLMRWLINLIIVIHFLKNNKVYLGYKLKQVNTNYINNGLFQNKTITIKYLKKHLLLEFFLNISPSQCNIISTFYYIRIIKILYFENSLVSEFYCPISAHKTILLGGLLFLLVFLFMNTAFCIFKLTKLCLIQLH